MKLPILYQDDDLLAVDKPVALPTHATHEDVIAMDVTSLARAQQHIDYLAVHHRLDRDTSGVLAFATSRAANAGLAQAFADHEAAKYYLAVVHGRPMRPRGNISAPIGRLASGVYAVGDAVPPSVAQEAVSRYRVEAESPRGRYSLISIVPETGRTHQIRLHLAHIGVPVVGDTLYDPEHRLAPRLLLHADRLDVTHPVTGVALSLRSRPPSIFGRLSTGLPELGLTKRLSMRPTEHRAHAPLVAALVRLAMDRRIPLVLDPETTCYRLLNGAGDGVPGLTLDVFGEAATVPGMGRRVGVVTLYPAAQDDPLPDAWRPLLSDVRDLCGVTSLYLKVRQPRSDALSDDERADAAPSTPLVGPASDVVLVRENGLAYVIRPATGLTVGLFLDMREMRARVQYWSNGKRVLNLFAYTCGFGVAAMAGGAARVLNIDLSRRFLDWGKESYQANSLVPDPHDFVDGDVFEWLPRLARRSDRFNLVIADPPGFARARHGYFAGAQDYTRLTTQCAAVAAPGARLIIACNQSRIQRRAFRDAVLAGLKAAQRRPVSVQFAHEPPLDYPPVGDEEPYLKVLMIELD